MHATRTGPRRTRALLLLGTLAVAGACSRRTLQGAAPDGTDAAPFDVRDVDTPPRLVECAPGAFRLPAGTPGGSGHQTAYALVVRADGTVVPGSVRPRPSGNDGLDAQRRVGAAPEQAVLTCRFAPGLRAGQPVAVRLSRTFGAP